MKRLKPGRRQEHKPRDLLVALADSTADRPISISAWAKSLGLARQTLTEYLPGFRAKGWIRTCDGPRQGQYLTEEGRELLAGVVP